MKTTSLKKYPRTFHFKFSPGVQSDDKVIPNLSKFIGQEVVLTEKLDGENTTLASDCYYARSIDSVYNWTRAWVSRMHSVLKHDIPVGLKLVGENLFAEHSIRYENLNSYFYLFSIWEDVDGQEDKCLPYDTICEYAALLDIPMPKVLYRGIFDENIIRNISSNLDSTTVEGLVCRVTKGFSRSEFKDCVAKYVRKGHVQTDQHWLKNAKQNGSLVEDVMPKFMK